VVTVLGYGLMTAALCLLQRPPLPDVAIAAVLGACVGVLVRLAPGHQAPSVLVPVVAATASSTVAVVRAAPGRNVTRGATSVCGPGSAIPWRTALGSQVTFLPAFWLLVPGAVGLVGAAEVLGDPAAAGLEDIVEPWPRSWRSRSGCSAGRRPPAGRPRRPAG
jgi:uncharacterized membrane protein YjjB (DUF3815 family)